MTRDEAAARLNGRDYGDEMQAGFAKEMASAGLVAIYGASDDLVEFDGAIREETGAYSGALVHITPDHHIHDDDEHEMDTPKGSIWVEAHWSPKEPSASWLIEAQVPGSPFDIMEDGELFCRGLVLDLREAFAAHHKAEAVKAAAPDLHAALEGILAHYVEMADSGDCGFWNPEEEPLVIAARAALAKASPPPSPDTEGGRTDGR